MCQPMPQHAYGYTVQQNKAMRGEIKSDLVDIVHLAEGAPMDRIRKVNEVLYIHNG